jgi:hypothetical protein
MKKFSVLFLILLTGLVINSCNKPATHQDDQVARTDGQLSDPVYRQALMAAFTDIAAQNQATREAEFLPVFFTQQAFFVLDETMTKMAVFSTDLDGNDFLRENPDGTYSVHITSNTATNELYDYSTFDYYVGYNGNMVMNYSGPADLMGIYDMEGNLLGYIYNIIYPNNVSPATVWHGHGPVQLWGMGPELNLVGKLTASAKWKNVKTILELN